MSELPLTEDDVGGEEEERRAGDGPTSTRAAEGGDKSAGDVPPERDGATIAQVRNSVKNLLMGGAVQKSF